MHNNEELDAPRQSIIDEIRELENRLQDANKRLNQAQTSPKPAALSTSLPSNAVPYPSLHSLLLLADSALPLGSFAFSSGLESYLAHTKISTQASNFPLFLNLSLSSYASTTLPFVLAAHRDPERLVELDDVQDAAVMCTVGRRASVAQGRALLGIWERSFSASLPESSDIVIATALESLRSLTILLRTGSSTVATRDDLNALSSASAHLAPLFGVVCRALGISIEQTAYIFMLNHVKALLSAAVRASIFGPYHAQKVLAGHVVQHRIQEVVKENWDLQVEDAGQSVPVMDLWIGRHELLYSRIFNS